MFRELLMTKVTSFCKLFGYV